MTIFMFSCFF